MATDDERRRIEKGLREMAGQKVPCDLDCRLAEAVMGHDFCETPCDGCLSTVLTRLADLIEPKGIESEAFKPVESGGFDRDALLALADDLCGGYPYGLSHGGLEQLARRIRKACGVVG